MAFLSLSKEALAQLPVFTERTSTGPLETNFLFLLLSVFSFLNSISHVLKRIKKFHAKILHVENKTRAEVSLPAAFKQKMIAVNSFSTNQTIKVQPIGQLYKNSS